MWRAGGPDGRVVWGAGLSSCGLPVAGSIPVAARSCDAPYHRTVDRIVILARHGIFASFSDPLLHNHNHVAHASIAGESEEK